MLLSVEESGCAIAQIAVTDLKAGEVAKVHVHEDVQEEFCEMCGDLDITLDDETLHCKAEDFVWVERDTRHEHRAITDVRMMTIGCAIQ